MLIGTGERPVSNDSLRFLVSVYCKKKKHVAFGKKKKKITVPWGGLHVCSWLRFCEKKSYAFKKSNSQMPAFETKVQQRRANKKAVT